MKLIRVRLPIATAASAFEVALSRNADATSVTRFGRALLCIAGGITAARAQSFQGIGDLAGGIFESVAYGVSADGSTVVGRSQSAAGQEAVRWRVSGLVSLGDVAGGPIESFAIGANQDGSILVGSGRDATTHRGVRWDGTTLTQLPQASGHAGYSACMGISSDGQMLCGFNSNGTITGYSSVTGCRIDNGVLTPLPYQNDSGAYGQPSEDGRVLSGRVRLGGIQYQACYWTDTTLTLLPQLSGGPVYSQNLAISGDGAVQVGVSCSQASGTWNVGESCRWQNGVAQSLGAFPGAVNEGAARSCNRNGSIVVGYAMSTAGLRAYIWDAQRGMRDLGSVLVSDFGLNLTGWTLSHAFAMTPDGSVIVGFGINPAGDGEGWIARLGCGTAASYCTAGTTTNGCNATLASSGTPSASGAGSFTLSANTVEGQKQGLFFYGVNGAQATAWGTGSSFLCVKAPTQRMTAQNSGGTSGACNGTLSASWNAFLAANPSALGTPFSAGDVVNVQAWFRDPPSPKTTNLSNALSFEMCP